VCQIADFTTHFPDYQLNAGSNDMILRAPIAQRNPTESHQALRTLCSSAEGLAEVAVPDPDFRPTWIGLTTGSFSWKRNWSSQTQIPPSGRR
jgi:hypothetical protein